MEHRENSLDKILGTSLPILQIKSLVKQVAASDITVLITGESGTGKELVAHAIHDLSNRGSESFVTLNCGAIPEGIFESEIFGHEKGSFTSASQRREGYFEMADRGSIFLDEIGEMPIQVQVKMLRVIETASFLRVGGTKEINIDVRIIAATNKDLGYEAMQGRFRQDLYYRLKAVNITVPALRDRSEDIPILVNHFIHEFARQNGRPVPAIEPEALNLLQHQYWEGNVRELKNFTESLVALSPEAVISLNTIKIRLGNSVGNPNLPVIVNRPREELDQDLIYRTLLELRYEISSVKGLLQKLIAEREQEVDYSFSNAEEVQAYSLDEAEKEQIKRTLNDFNGNRRLAAKALGIGERTLYRKIKQYGMK